MGNIDSSNIPEEEGDVQQKKMIDYAIEDQYLAFYLEIA